LKVVIAAISATATISSRTVANSGVAVAAGIGGGVTMATSYLWGVLAFGEIPANVLLSVFGMLLAFIGGFGIASCVPIAERFLAEKAEKIKVKCSCLLTVTLTHSLNCSPTHSTTHTNSPTYTYSLLTNFLTQSLTC